MTADIRLLHWPDRDREEYERLAGALERIRAAVARSRGEIVATVPSGPAEPSAVDRARALLAQRRARDAVAGSLIDMFGEPGWDILLTLFVAHHEGRPVERAALTDTLALRPVLLERWLAVLTQRELVRTITLGQGAAQMSLTGEGGATVLRCMGEA